MMRTKSTYLALIAMLLSPMAAQADLITFDGSITGDPYTEGDFDFDLIVGNHYGDASVGGVGTLNWHNGGANAIDVVVRMTHASGLAFVLSSFDLVALGDLATDITVLGVAFSSPGTHVINSGPLFFVDFDLNPDGSISSALSVAIDNVNVSVVPEPGTLALLGIGLFGMGLARRRKRI